LSMRLAPPPCFDMAGFDMAGGEDTGGGTPWGPGIGVGGCFLAAR
jgi:hypothetical protein